MNVKQLIKQLQKMPQETQVMTWASLPEEHGYAACVTLIEKQEDVFYDKGDKPILEEFEDKKLVIIH